MRSMNFFIRTFCYDNLVGYINLLHLNIFITTLMHQSINFGASNQMI